VRSVAILLGSVILAATCAPAVADPFSAPNAARIAAARERAKLPVDQKAALDVRIPDVHCEAIPFGDMIDFVRDGLRTSLVGGLASPAVGTHRAQNAGDGLAARRDGARCVA
jgi:hypothetical protein